MMFSQTFSHFSHLILNHILSWPDRFFFSIVFSVLNILINLTTILPFGSLLDVVFPSSSINMCE